MVLKNGSGVKLVKALEVAWHDIQRRHTDLPDVVMITGSGQEPRFMRYGHYWHEQWSDGVKIKQSEVFVAGERMEMGGAEVLETLLHESCHALAKVRGIKDVSPDVKRHTAGFRDLALDIGLTCEQAGAHGWAKTDLTDETREEYKTTIDRLSRELELHRPRAGATAEGADGTAKAAKKSRNYLKAGCECGNTVRLGRTLLESGTLLCTVCDSAYKEVA